MSTLNDAEFRTAVITRACNLKPCIYSDLPENSAPNRMTYTVKCEKTPHGKAWVVVGPGGKEKLFFDKEKAEQHAKKMNAKVKQTRLEL